MLRIHLATLGCPKNMTDSRRLLVMAAQSGIMLEDDPSAADVILVNTCGFIKDAKEESISEILEFAAMKSSGWKGRLVVFGCLAERYRNDLVKEIPELDALFGVGEDQKIIEYCLEVNKEEKAHDRSPLSISATCLPGVGKSYAYLKIADGCDKRCSYCVIPSIRGRFRSVPHKLIVAEAEEFARSGIKEIILVAQDICAYKDCDGQYSLEDLLKDLTAIEGDFRVRLLYLYPTEISDELIDLIADNEKIIKYLDIPLQHSEDRILRLMGRRGSRKEYLKLIRKIRRRIPGVTLRTTIMTGFPSESEEEFLSLLDFIEEARFERLGVFAYSREEGSPAAALKGQIPEKIKKRRLDEIMKRQSLISLAYNQELIGRKFRALVDEIDDAVIICRLESQAPEIDGVVIVDVSDIKKKSQIGAGEAVNVEIVDAFDYDLKGRLVEDEAHE